MKFRIVIENSMECEILASGTLDAPEGQKMRDALTYFLDAERFHANVGDVIRIVEIS